MLRTGGAPLFALLLGVGCGQADDGGKAAGSMPGMDMSGAGMADEKGVHVSPDVATKLGIATEPATAGDVQLVRRAPASVGWDPLAVTRVTAQPGGQVRKLSLPRPGEPVTKGEIVARLYQPEVRAAFEELRVANGAPRCSTPASAAWCSWRPRPACTSPAR